MNSIASNIARKAGALFAAGAIAFSTLPLSALAAPSDIIDTSRTGSLTVHKYDLTAAEQGGVDVNQFKATGETDTVAESALERYALQGVVFSYARVGAITTFSKDGDVEVVYDLPASLRSILSLETDAAETSEGDSYYYTSDQINAALASLLTDNTSGKDRLEEWASSNGITAMTETDAKGVTSVSEMELGLYLVIETQVPEEVNSTTDPFFVSVPMTDATGDYWNYDVVVYPKNQSNQPTLDKVVSENGSYADTATVSEGDVLNYRLVSRLPVITSTATYLTRYTYVDELSKGLTYNQDVSVSFYEREEDAKNGTGTVVTTWTQQDSPAFFQVDYESAGNGSRMTLTPTEAGFQEVNTKFSGLYMVVAYTAKVTSTADMVCGDAGNTNTAQLTYGRTNTTYYDTIEDKAIVYTYGIHLTKTFSDNEGDATKVQFVLKNQTDDYFVTASGSDGVYYVTGQAAEESGATTLSPSASGDLMVNGLEGDTYVLTEIATDGGYSLLKEPITIAITPADTTVMASIAAVTGSESAQPEVKVSVNSAASAQVDQKDATMSDAGDSAHALVELSVLNSKTFVLPKTGGAGTWLVTICGVLGVAGGTFVLCRGKRKKR